MIKDDCTESSAQSQGDNMQLKMRIFTCKKLHQNEHLSKKI